LKVRLGTRGSDLALWQARHVAGRLAPEAEVEIVVLQTRGDRIDDVPLTGVEGKAFFTAEIERALLEGAVDLAVHSHKDLPTENVPGLDVVAVPGRGPAEECLLAGADGWDERGALVPLVRGARVGTSSPRRQQQLLALRPDLFVEPLRGNVPTRVRRLREGRWQAILLALAGLQRLQLDLRGLHVRALPPGLIVPAPAQGALAVQVRADDGALAALCRRKLHDEDTHAAIAAERWLLQHAGGGCNLPLGAHVTAQDGDGHGDGAPGRFLARGFLGAGHPEPGRTARWAQARGGSPAAAAALLLARLAQPGATGSGPLAGLSVALVGSGGEAEGSRTGRRLQQLGAHVRHERVLELEDIDSPELERLCAELRPGDALVITSRRAVARLTRTGCVQLPAGVLVAAVGPATAAALEPAGLHADYVGPGGARGLAATLPLARGARAVFPCAEGAGHDLETVLASRGVAVERVPVYRTVTARDPDPEAAADVRVWMSPSAQRASGELGRATGSTLGPGLLFSETEALVAQLAALAAARADRALEPTP